MAWTDVLKTVAPTIASALGGPLAGAAVTALGGILGIDGAQEKDIANAIADGKLTPEHLAEIRKLELQYQADEKERGFRYSELAFKDRDSARTNNTAGGIQGRLFAMSVILLLVTLGSEVAVLFAGYPKDIPEMVVGRVLGLMDAVATLVLAYYYGTSAGSAAKTEMLAQK